MGQSSSEQVLFSVNFLTFLLYPTISSLACFYSVNIACQNTAIPRKRRERKEQLTAASIFAGESVLGGSHVRRVRTDKILISHDSFPYEARQSVSTVTEGLEKKK